MTLPKVETFEKDIAEEVVHKEENMVHQASAERLINEVTEQVAPKQEVTTDDGSNKKKVIFIVLLLILIAGGAFAYVTFLKTETPPPVTTSKPKVAVPLNSFSGIFPGLASGLGRFITKTDRSVYGFNFTITEYTPVFSYIIKNEELFTRLLAGSLGNQGELPDVYVFTDVTVSNQNMRVGTSGSSTVTYAFVGTNNLIVSTSTEGVLTIIGATMK